MTTDRRAQTWSLVSTTWLSLALVLSTACVAEGDKDGSQTHFTGQGDASTTASIDAPPETTGPELTSDDIHEPSDARADAQATDARAADESGSDTSEVNAADASLTDIDTDETSMPSLDDTAPDATGTDVTLPDVTDSGEMVSSHDTGEPATDDAGNDPDTDTDSQPDAVVCDDQAAGPSGLMCGDLVGYAFVGWQCTAIYCQCVGDDCDDLEPTEEACLNRFATCLERPYPACTDKVFPVLYSDPGYTPNYPPFGFTVEGFDTLYDDESGSPTVFEDWTSALWLGWDDPAEPGFCDGIPPQRYTPDCPSARPLLLQVNGETVRIEITLHWDDALLETVTPADVEVRISAHASDTLVLQVRDAASEQPVVMMVQSLGDHTRADAPWEFEPFTFTAGEPYCATDVDMCNWTFSALNLDVTAADQTQSVPPLGAARINVGGAAYAIRHGVIFAQEAADEACAAEKPWSQNFALLQVPTEE